MDRDYLKGAAGDAINAVLAAAVRRKIHLSVCADLPGQLSRHGSDEGAELRSLRSQRNASAAVALAWNSQRFLNYKIVNHNSGNRSSRVHRK
jgi:hypothetical protein